MTATQTPRRHRVGSVVAAAKLLDEGYREAGPHVEHGGMRWGGVMAGLGTLVCVGCDETVYVQI